MAIPVRIVERRRVGCATVFGIAFMVTAAAIYWVWAIPIIAVVIGARVISYRLRRARFIASGKTVTTLYALAPEHFEQYVSLMLERLGWSRVRWVGGPGDGGADVTAIDPQGLKCVVQAKRYAPNATVGSPIVQALLGAQMIHKADRSILVTTGRFTPAAVELAALMDVELIDGTKLIAMSPDG